MNKTTKKDFELFVTECKIWIKKLELSNWAVYYWHKSSTNNSLAYCTRNLSGMRADVHLNTEWSEQPVTKEEIKNCAKHEILHIFLGRMAENAEARFCSLADIDETEEELVNKLIKMI